MKYDYYSTPDKMKHLEAWGFNWLEFVTSIPAPMFLVTSYKSNGKANACMQSWASFTTGDRGTRFFVILSSVNKSGHLYRTIIENGCAVVNFMSADFYDNSMETIKNNQFEVDEIVASSLTSVPADKVNAPMIEECFMNLECTFSWEKEIVPNDDHVIVCLEVVNVHIDKEHLDNRVEENGILYNIHHPINPEKYSGKAHDYVGIVKPIIDAGEY
jgi:flavin reductase (DIM6/NTAB) family NADH-FMN oxidoreductase RutF